MNRFKLTIEYDGGGFVGWQRQDSGPSVQQSIEDAVHAFCGERVTVHAAGRTDAGVHALGQVAHLDIARETTPDTVRDAINFHLKPAAIVVLQAEIASPEFHARFAATSRVYRYRIVNRRTPLALDRGRAWAVPAPLDAVAMHEAAQRLVGRHDFTSFRAALCQADSPVRTLDSLMVARDGDDVWLTARARSFLHHQVRNIVGTLKFVGEGRWTSADVASALAACDRSAAGPTAPAEGLYLVEVCYDRA